MRKSLNSLWNYSSTQHVRFFIYELYLNSAESITKNLIMLIIRKKIVSYKCNQPLLLTSNKYFF